MTPWRHLSAAQRKAVLAAIHGQRDGSDFESRKTADGEPRKEQSAEVRDACDAALSALDVAAGRVGWTDGAPPRSGWWWVRFRFPEDGSRVEVRHVVDIWSSRLLMRQDDLETAIRSDEVLAHAPVLMPEEAGEMTARIESAAQAAALGSVHGETWSKLALEALRGEVLP